MELDDDIRQMTLPELQAKLQEIRNAVRWWAEQQGDDRCWLDDIKIMQLVLPHGKVDFKLPPCQEFLANCKRFWETRQEPGKENQIHEW